MNKPWFIVLTYFIWALRSWWLVKSRDIVENEALFFWWSTKIVDVSFVNCSIMCRGGLTIKGCIIMKGMTKYERK